MNKILFYMAVLCLSAAFVLSSAALSQELEAPGADIALSDPPALPMPDSAETDAVTDAANSPHAHNPPNAVKSSSENISENDINNADGNSAETASDETQEETAPAASGSLETIVLHASAIAPFTSDTVMHAKITTNAGELSCELYAGTHPLTVLNFISLASGRFGWPDASGKMHTDAYYADLPFAARVKGAYVTTADRPEGTGFKLTDERCTDHKPIAGALAMVQIYPGQAAAKFMILARDIPEFAGMYTIFGHCGPIETIDALTRKDDKIKTIDIDF